MVVPWMGHLLGVERTLPAPHSQLICHFYLQLFFVAITSCKQAWSRGQRWGAFILPGAVEWRALTYCKCVHSKRTRPCRRGQTSALGKEGVDNAGTQRTANPGFEKDREASYPHRIQSLYRSSCFSFEKLKVLWGTWNRATESHLLCFRFYYKQTLRWI